jgi:adenylosuccinate synthase
MPITVIEGEQRGDEGKGRFVDMLIPDYDIGARFNGGDNAGHTVVAPDGEVYKLHGLPTSVVHEDKTSVIGNGVVINPVNLVREMETLEAQGINIDPCKLLISSAAHLILPHHISEDEIRESSDARQGSTKSGIAQVYGAKALREGVQAHIIKNNPQKLFEIVEKGLLMQRHKRVEEWLPSIDEEAVAFEYVEAAQRLGAFVTDTARYIGLELEKGKKILAEGAQAFLLDVDHGMYPMTTSSTTTSGGATFGLGAPVGAIDKVIGVSKVIQSHVGGGPFVTEIKDPELLAQLHGDMSKVDAERGTTTGRTRRLGYLDLAQIRRSQRINDVTEMALTKLDWISRFGDQLQVCVAYERKGKVLRDSVDNAEKLKQSKPIYESLPNWEENIQDVREFADLPDNAQNFVSFIEDQTGKHIKYIGVGPGRDQVIVR